MIKVDTLPKLHMEKIFVLQNNKVSFFSNLKFCLLIYANMSLIKTISFDYWGLFYKNRDFISEYLITEGTPTKNDIFDQHACLNLKQPKGFLHYKVFQAKLKAHSKCAFNYILNTKH